MSTEPTLPLVPVDEYLNTSYEPDVEYVNGVLVEKGMPTIAHSYLERLLLFWFAQFETPLRFVALHEIRTQIIERARYRLPDFMLVPKPLPRGRIVNIVPWVVVEIVSPDDTINKTPDRFFDYNSIGVQTLLQMDPEEYVVHRFENGSMIQIRLESILLPTGTVPFDSEELFRRLREDLAKFREGTEAD